MSKTKLDPNFLLDDRANDASMEVDLVRSTWDSFAKGKTLSQKELQDVFAFDFSDIIPSMNWDDTSKKQ